MTRCSFTPTIFSSVVQCIKVDQVLSNGRVLQVIPYTTMRIMSREHFKKAELYHFLFE